MIQIERDMQRTVVPVQLSTNNLRKYHDRRLEPGSKQ